MTRATSPGGGRLPPLPGMVIKGGDFRIHPGMPIGGIFSTLPGTSARELR